jgi:glycosyltransferase involved in cell wall biosynthesis
MLAERWWAFLRRIDVVAVTAPAADGVAQHGGHAVVIPHAYDPEMFTPGGMSDDARLRVSFVGRLVEEKGIRLLLSAATHLASVRVSIAGAGPLEPDVEACCKAHSHVEFLGHLTGASLVDVYRHSHVLVLPSVRRSSWEELFGISLIEAFACGATAMSSNHVGPTSIITDHHDGLILRETSPSSILEALRLLDKDRALLGILRKNALRTAQTRYEVSIVASRWAEVLDG